MGLSNHFSASKWDQELHEDFLGWGSEQEGNEKFLQILEEAAGKIILIYLY